MKRVFLLALCLVAASWCASGCATRVRTTRPSATRAPDDIGVQVLVQKGGKLRLYNREISREKLVRRLIEEEQCDRGARAVMLEAAPGVDVGDLRLMREYLVKNRIPRVVLVTRPTVSSSASPAP